MRPRGTSIIFLNDLDQILLFLRDDIPTIKYPNQWDLPGGGAETGETPAEAIAREMQEEIGIELVDFELFEQFEFPDRTEFTFWKRENFDLDKLVLTEGQKLRWFNRFEAAATPLAFGFNDTVERFFRRLAAR
jgi:8-oxo-dGTP diphosphatase